jgi:hypothetical protein
MQSEKQFKEIITCLKCNGKFNEEDGMVFSCVQEVPHVSSIICGYFCGTCFNEMPEAEIVSWTTNMKE